VLSDLVLDNQLMPQ